MRGCNLLSSRYFRRLFKIYSFFESVNNVFHLASEVSIPYCVEKPNESMFNNIVASMNVLNVLEYIKLISSYYHPHLLYMETPHLFLVMKLNKCSV